MNLANRNGERSSSILTILSGTEVHGTHLHDQGRRSLQNSMQVLATFYIPIEHMILNGTINGYILWIEITNTTNDYYMSICLCVQIKGGPHIGHLLESNLSRHTFHLHINGPFQQCSIHGNCYIYMTVNMDTALRHVYYTYFRDSGKVHYKLSNNFLI